MTTFALRKSVAAVAVLLGAGLAQAMNPGVYETSANGIDGPVTVKTEVSADKIVKVEVVNHKETAGIGTTAIDTIPGRIVETQSVAVDVVSGATVTSNAILAAVAAAIEKAGGDIKVFQVKPQATGPVKTREMKTQFLIIGGGGAGQTAAIRANELGVKTLLLEKQAMLGGAFAMHGGWMIVTGADVQKRLGVTGDSPNAMIHDFLANGQYENDLDKLVIYARNVGPTVNWLESYVGLKFDEKRGLQRQGEYVFDRVLFYEGNTPGILRTFKAKLDQAKNLDIVTGARAEELIIKEGRVTGVKATMADGTKLTVTADAVLLATGGYGANKEMLQEPVKSSLYYGPVCSTGDGFRMAEAAGATLHNMQFGKLYPNGVEVAAGEAKSTLFGNNAALLESAIIVNQKGVRVVDEKASNHTILTALLAEPSKTFYLVMDEKGFTAWRNNVAANMISQTEIDAWLAADGKKPPLLVKGDTLEAAAKKAGIDAAALAETVKRYNGFVKAGEDKDFRRPAKFMLNPIPDKGPFYIVEQKPRFATTLGSIVSTDEFEVLGKNGKPITNLFVAGESTNSVHGNDSPIGANAGWACTSGKLAAEAAAKRILGK